MLRKIKLLGVIGALIVMILMVIAGLRWYNRWIDSVATDRLQKQQQQLLLKYAYRVAHYKPPEDVKAIYEAAFAEGEAVGAAGIKVKEVVKWQTKEVTIESPCGIDENLSISAEVHEAKVEDVGGAVYLSGYVGVDLHMPERAWSKHVDLPINSTSVDWVIAKPEKLDIKQPPAKWRLGKGFVCGPGAFAGVAFDPTGIARASVGVGAACVYGWGLVK